jgi:AcrR family transcriptional regulator
VPTSDAGEQDRAAFVDAALDLLAELETVDLQVAEVVRRVGRHRTAFYACFGSKDGLVLAVVQEAVRRTAEVLDEHMAQAATPADAVRAWARTLLRLASGRSQGVQALALDRFRLMRRFPESQASTTHPLSAPLEEVLATTGLTASRVLSEAALELVMSRQATWIALGHAPGEDEVATYADLVVRLVGLE